MRQQLGFVIRFSAQYSPQGLQSPGVFLGTTCNGNDHWLADGHTIPCSSICLYSSICLLVQAYVYVYMFIPCSCCVTARFSGGSCHALAQMDSPVVHIWCVTLCLIV